MCIRDRILLQAVPFIAGNDTVKEHQKGRQHSQHQNHAEQRPPSNQMAQVPYSRCLLYTSPSIRETDLSGDFDTSGEADNTVLPGLQHKYRQTALILSTHLSLIHI